MQRKINVILLEHWTYKQGYSILPLRPVPSFTGIIHYQHADLLIGHQFPALTPYPLISLSPKIY